MSNYDLRPHVNQPDRMPDYDTGSGSFGLWILVFGAIVVGLFAIMLLSSGGETQFSGPDDGSRAAPETLGAAPVPSTPQPTATGE